MSGWLQRRERFGGRARAAATVAVVGVAVASLGTVALGSSSASAREGRSRTSVDFGEALAAGRDGKLVVAGLGCSGRNFALARYTAAGTLDRSFGTGGKVLTGFGARSFAAALAVAIQADGKVVAVGGGSGRFALVRYTLRGSLDRSFGRGGKVLTDFGARSSASANAVAIQPDGKIVAVGNGPGRFALARYTLRGSLDRSFGRGGKVLTDFGARSSASANAVAIQPDGKIVAVGNGPGRFALARYTLRGSLDRSFGRGGKVLTDFGARSSASANAVAIQPDGKIVVAGDRSELTFALARYNANGTLDRSFGEGGRVVTKVGGNYASGLVVQPDGKLVAAGAAGRTVIALVRYSPDGRLDPSFGDGGTVVTTAARGSGLAIQRDRKLVTAGTGSGRSGRGVFALARFLEDGSFDASFGRGGKLLTAFPFPRKAVANAVVVRADGKIVVAGTVGGHDFGLARYSSSGRLDGSFGRGGKVMTDFGSVCATRGR